MWLMQDVPQSSGVRHFQPWRVWLVTDVYPPDCGGSGWSTHALARVLSDNGHRVEIIMVDPSATEVTSRSYEGMTVTDVGVRALRTLANRLGATDYAHAVLSTYLDTRLHMEPDVDIVHAQHLHSGPPAIAAGRAHARATVVTVRDYWPVCLHGTSWWGSQNCDGCTTANLTACMAEYWRWPAPVSRVMVGWARRRLRSRAEGLADADKILAVSEAVQRRVAGALPGADLSVVPNIVDPDSVNSQAAPGRERPAPYLLTAGKLQPTKGFDLLLSAMAECGASMPLVVAGDGPHRAALEAQAAAAGLDVAFLGWVEHGRLLALQRDAHAVLLPSAWQEPLSRLVLETMGLGTPVVAWDCGGTPEIIEPGVSGWLVKKPSDVRSALMELESPDRRSDVAQASLKRVRERFSPSVVYPAIAEAYAAAIEKSRHTTARTA